MKLLILQFSPSSCHFLSLRLTYSPQHPVFNLCSSLNVRNHVSHPQKSCKIVVLYILIFKFLESRREDKGF
jgi:hypothetical protein